VVKHLSALLFIVRLVVLGQTPYGSCLLIFQPKSSFLLNISIVDRRLVAPYSLLGTDAVQLIYGFILPEVWLSPQAVLYCALGSGD